MLGVSQELKDKRITKQRKKENIAKIQAQRRAAMDRRMHCIIPNESYYISLSIIFNPNILRNLYYCSVLLDYLLALSYRSCSGHRVQYC